MAPRTLRAVVALQACAVVSGVRRAGAADEVAQEFPSVGLLAAGATLGHTLRHGGLDSITQRAVGPWMSAVGAPPSLDQPPSAMSPSATSLMASIRDLPEDWRYNLVNIKPLARGEEARIFSARLRNKRDQLVAMKVVTPKNDEEYHTVLEEMRFLDKFKHAPGVVTMHRVAYDGMLRPGEEVVMLLEHASGNLRDQVLSKSFSDVSVETRLRLFADIVRAVHDLETARVSHRNLKPDNVLILGDCSTSSCSAVLCDFGEACNFPFNSSAEYETWIKVDYKGLAEILRRLIKKAGLDEDQTSPETEWINVLEANVGDGGVLGGLAKLLKAMAESKAHVHLPTVAVLKAVEAIAQENGVELSEREVPKLHGWSKLRSPIRKFIPIPVTGSMDEVEIDT